MCVCVFERERQTEREKESVCESERKKYADGKEKKKCPSEPVSESTHELISDDVRHC